MNGYQSLRDGAAWVDVSGRGKIRLTGEDRVRLLHAMTTNDIRSLQPGQGCYTFFLNAQGRILADANVLCGPEDLLLDTEPETAAGIYEHLDKFIIADDVTIEDLTGGTASYALEGPQAIDILGDLAPAGDNAYTARDNWTVFRHSLTGRPNGFLLFGPAGQRPPLLDGVEQADAEALRVVRLENGQPRYGEEISERFLTQETGQMHAVSFQKGCYLGQEIVERVRSRAQIHRRLLPLRIAGQTVPAAGTKLQAGGKDAAEIVSSAYSPALGEVVALAYVRIDVKPGGHRRQW